MINRHPQVKPFFLLFFWLALAGCGSEESGPATQSSPPPAEPPTCEALAPLVLQDPLTGGTFHCFGCNRVWHGKVPVESGRLFVLVFVSCERLRGGAFLELRDTAQSLVWKTEVRQGDHETFCIRHEGLPGDTLSLRLQGARSLPSAGNLVEEFRGSVYLRLFNERGEPVERPVQ